MKLTEYKALKEEEAVEIFLQLVNGFKILIHNKIIHRDFKLANILCSNNTVKIADFGFAKILDDSSFTETMLGSPLNMAPEIIKGLSYNNQVDIWSLGSCFYHMLFGEYPFNAKSLDELHRVILRGKIEFPENKKISEEVIDLLK